jgi:hypothetical protein
MTVQVFMQPFGSYITDANLMYLYKKQLDGKPVIGYFAETNNEYRSFVTEKERDESLEALLSEFSANEFPCVYSEYLGVYINVKYIAKYEIESNTPTTVNVYFANNKVYVRTFKSESLANSCIEELTKLIKENGSSGGGSGETSDYSSLSNKPQINGVELSGNKTTTDLKINIPTKTSELTNDSGFITSIPDEYVTDSELTAKGYITKDVNNLTNYTPTSSLSSVATSGSYNDLTNKPVIPEEYVLPTASTTVLGGVKVDGSTITIQDGVISSTASGGGTTDYTNLSNKPQINSVELTGNKSLEDLGIQAAGEYALKSEIPTVPTKTSELQNDSGFLTSAPVASVNGETGTVIVKSIQDSNTNSIMYKLWVGSKEQYDAIETKDEETLYYIKKDGTPIDIYELLDKKQDKLTVGTGISIVVDSEAGTSTINNTMPNVQSDWNATDGLSVILNKPTIPTKNSQLENDSDYVTLTELAEEGYAKDSELSAVAKSGSYNDLTNKPTIPPAYTLPTASSSVLGGVKIGNGLSVSGDGTISVDSSTNTPIEDLTDFATGIQEDKIYKSTITAATTIVLPTVTNKVVTHSIIIYLSVGEGGSVADFGTTSFYNTEKPVPVSGESYDLAYVYNPIRDGWVLNAIKVNTL